MLRRLAHHQPETFAFTPANQAWAEAQITKYPEGRQASAIIPLLWRAQEQEGWLTRPAIEGVANMLGMAYIRALEVATFYFMFQLHPTGSVAHVQVCGTTSCMICGAEDLIAVCKSKIAPGAHAVSADGKLSWEEVECLGACANAPMAQIGKDYYEDLTAESFGRILDDLVAGKVPTPGSQIGRFASEPASGLTALLGDADHEANASVTLATTIGDTVKRIDGTEVPLVAPWTGAPGTISKPAEKAAKADTTAGPTAEQMDDKPGKPEVGDVAEAAEAEGAATSAEPSATPAPGAPTDVSAPAAAQDAKPEFLTAPQGEADDLKKIKGVGPKLEQLLHNMGVYHYAQVAGWTDAEVAWVDDNLEGFRGRVSRDGWVEQARILADGGETEFSKRAKY